MSRKEIKTKKSTMMTCYVCASEMMGLDIQQKSKDSYHQISLTRCCMHATVRVKRASGNRYKEELYTLHTVIVIFMKIKFTIIIIIRRQWEREWERCKCFRMEMAAVRISRGDARGEIGRSDLNNKWCAFFEK